MHVHVHVGVLVCICGVKAVCVCACLSACVTMYMYVYVCMPAYIQVACAYVLVHMYYGWCVWGAVGVGVGMFVCVGM